MVCIESFITAVNFLFLTKLEEKLPSAQVSICSLDIAFGAVVNLELLKLHVEGFQFPPLSARGFVKVAGNQCKWKTISNSIAERGGTEILRHVHI